MPEGLDPIGWIVIGFIAGSISGWIVGDRSARGCLPKILVGIVGGLLGGWLWTSVLNQDRAGGFLGALLIAVLGSALVLVLIRALSRD